MYLYLYMYWGNLGTVTFISPDFRKVLSRAIVEMINFLHNISTMRNSDLQRSLLALQVNNLSDEELYHQIIQLIKKFDRDPAGHATCHTLCKLPVALKIEKVKGRGHDPFIIELMDNLPPAPIPVQANIAAPPRINLPPLPDLPRHPDFLDD